jgi:DTW domain-containing protein YfiP
MDECERCQSFSLCCYCSELPIEPFDHDIRVIVLQDSYELSPSKLKVSSVPMLKHILKNYASYVPSSQDWKNSESINFGSCVVLYPSKSSIPLPEYIQTFPKPQTLIVLDGSWVSVQELLYQLPYLHPTRITHVRLSSDQLQNRVSLYHSMGLRKEPAKNFISTAEAIALSLHAFDSNNLITSTILNTFQSFVQKRVPRTQTHEPSSSESSEDENEERQEEKELLLSDQGRKEKRKISKVQSRAKKRSKEKRKRRHR